MSTWSVQYSSGTFLDIVTVQADSMYSAIEKALIELEDETGNWPWSAIDCDITVRRLEP